MLDIPESFERHCWRTQTNHGPKRRAACIRAREGTGSVRRCPERESSRRRYGRPGGPVTFRGCGCRDPFRGGAWRSCGEGVAATVDKNAGRCGMLDGGVQHPERLADGINCLRYGDDGRILT